MWHATAVTKYEVKGLNPLLFWEKGQFFRGGVFGAIVDMSILIIFYCHTFSGAASEICMYNSVPLKLKRVDLLNAKLCGFKCTLTLYWLTELHCYLIIVSVSLVVTFNQ